MTTQKQSIVGAGSLGVTGGQRADVQALPASPSGPCDLTEVNVQSALVTHVRFSTCPRVSLLEICSSVEQC